MKRVPLRNMRPAAELSPRALALRAKHKAEREAKARALHAAQFGPQAALCRLGPCQGCGRAVRCDPHHWPYTAHGGLDADTCALCPFDRHKAAHRSRQKFEVRCGRTVAGMVQEMRDRLAALRAPAPAAHESLQAVAS